MRTHFWFVCECVRVKVSFFLVTLHFSLLRWLVCWFDTIFGCECECMKHAAFGLFVGADLKIGTNEKPIKVKSQLRIGDVFIMNVMRISHATSPASAVRIEIVPDLRACASVCVCVHILRNVHPHVIHFALTWKSHSFKQINEKHRIRQPHFSALHCIFKEFFLFAISNTIFGGNVAIGRIANCQVYKSKKQKQKRK